MFDTKIAVLLRDDLGAMNRALEKQAVVFGDGTDADVIGVAEDTLAPRDFDRLARLLTGNAVGLALVTGWLGGELVDRLSYVAGDVTDPDVLRTALGSDASAAIAPNEPERTRESVSCERSGRIHGGCHC